MASWDVIVVGVGGVGSSAAMHLAKAGVRVLGIDQYPPAHDRGSSHGKTRVIRQAYFEHPSYVPLLRRAYELWEELETESRNKLFFRTGLVEMGPSDGVVIPGILRSAKEHELSIEHLHANEVIRRWPAMGGEEDWQAVIEKDAGFLKVEACVEAHLQLATKAGATLLHGDAVKSWESVGDGVEVTTERGKHHAARLLIAGGPWSHLLVDRLSSPLQILLKQQYWYQPAGPGLAVSDGFPCFFHETPYGFFYGFPALGDSGVKVARHSGGPVISGPSDEGTEDAEDRQLVENYLRDYMPGVSQTLLSQAKCYYTTTPDEHFVMDQLADHPRVTVIAGLSGHGFKFTSVLGEIARDLVMGKTSPLNIDLFRIGRF
ncbi:MAG: N-methyl-L-tryptophan oxidase [Rubripirellula sp.]